MCDSPLAVCWLLCWDSWDGRYFDKLLLISCVICQLKILLWLFTLRLHEQIFDNLIDFFGYFRAEELHSTLPWYMITHFLVVFAYMFANSCPTAHPPTVDIHSGSPSCSDLVSAWGKYLGLQLLNVWLPKLVANFVCLSCLVLSSLWYIQFALADLLKTAAAVSSRFRL